MTISNSDINRIKTALNLHKSAVDRSGGVEFFRIIVVDKKGSPLGEVALDKAGDSVFSEIGVKK